MDVRDLTKSRLAGSEQPKVDQVKKTAEDINTVRSVVGTAEELAGVKGYQDRIKERDDKNESLRTENDELKGKVHETELSSLKEYINLKIDGIMNEGAKGKDVVGQIQQLKEAAEIMGMKRGEEGVGKERTAFDFALSMLERMAPKQTSIVESLRELLEVKTLLLPEEKRAAETPAMGPPELQFQIAKLNTESAITLEKLKDDRQEREHRFQFDMKKFEVQTAQQAAEINAKINAQREQTQLFASGFEQVGNALAKGFQDRGGGGGGGAAGNPIAGAARGVVKGAAKGVISPILEAAVGESGSIECESCQEEMFLAADATQTICPGCQTVYDIKRVGDSIAALE